MSSPLFEPAKPHRDQLEIPMGTHHIDANGQSFVCDVANCRMPFRADEQPRHSEREENAMANARQSEMF